MDNLAEMISRLAITGFNPATDEMVGYMMNTDYKIIDGKTLRIVGITLLAQLDGDRLIEFDAHLPYGFLHAEAENQSFCVAIIHKEDFTRAYEIQEYLDEKDVYVQHQPSTGFLKVANKFLPRFKYSVYFRGDVPGIDEPLGQLPA